MNIPRTTAKITLHTKADTLFIIAPFLSDNGCSCHHSGIRSTSNNIFIIQTIVRAVNEKQARISSKIMPEPDFILHKQLFAAYTAF